jgi:diguanylate cyclase (GGDEF)-like protein
MTMTAAAPIDGAGEARPASAATRSIVDHIAGWSRRTSGAFAAIALTLVALLVLINRVYDPRVQSALDAEQVARAANAAMVNQEASLRSYVLSGDEKLLAPFRRAADDQRRLDAQVDQLIGSDATVRPLLLDVRAAQETWIGTWVPAALGSGRPQRPSTDPNPLLIEGKQLFDQYRAAHEVLTAALAEHRDNALAVQSRTILLAASLALLVTVVVAAGSVQSNRRLRRSVGPPFEAIAQQLAAIAQGDFSPTTPAGPSEARRMIEGLNATARALDDAHAREVEQAEATLAQNHQLAQVLRVAREIAGSLNLRYVLRALCTAASSIAGEQRVVVWLQSEDAPIVEPHVDSTGPELHPLGVEPVAVGHGVVGRAAQHARIEGHGSTHDDGAAGAGSVAIPMVVGAEVIGVIELCGPSAAALPRRTMDVLEALAVQAASAVASARLHQVTEELARTDALTRLPNRRVLEADLDTEVGVSTRYERPLAFAMLDVDHFKAYNDTLGHQAADVALQELARLLARSVRTGDTVYRYGGEEIAILLRETTAEAAREHAERLRAAVEQHFARPGQPRAVTVSIGVAAMPEHATSGSSLVAAADSALYEAKRGGRNRTCVAEGVAQPTG